MGRVLEIAEAVTRFIHATLNPVYRINDIPPEYDPLKKVFLRNEFGSRIIDQDLTILSWNICRGYKPQEIRSALTINQYC